MELEEEFEITIPDDQAEKIKTVGEAIDYIEREQAEEMTRRVVITGMGTVNPLSSDVPTYWRALCAGKSGIGHHRAVRHVRLQGPVRRRSERLRSRGDS